MALAYTATEMMTAAAARALKSSDVCFVGIDLPSAACNLARLTHAPGIKLIYESGTIETKPNVLPLSIGDGELCDTALTTVSVPEMFRYWLQGGRITVGFLGGAQIDRFANLNTIVIGPYDKPTVRLPGSGGAPEIASCCGEIFITMRQSKRSFVDKVDFITSLGHGEGGDHRARLGIKTKGPTKLITDLCVFEPDPETREMTASPDQVRGHAAPDNAPVTDQPHSCSSMASAVDATALPGSASTLSFLTTPSWTSME